MKSRLEILLEDTGKIKAELDEQSIFAGLQEITRAESLFAPRILHTLRERRGLEPSDSSQDDKIAEYTPTKAFSEIAAWHLGDLEWGPTILQWLRECHIIKINDIPQKLPGTPYK